MSPRAPRRSDPPRITPRSRSTNRAVFGLVLTTAVCSLVRGEPDARVESPAELLIAGARVVEPSTGTVTAPRDLFVADGRIIAVAEAGTLPHRWASRVVDASDLYALPGLIDVHAHIGDGGLGAQGQSDREGALAQFLRYGVTTIFVPGGGGGNDEQLARWKTRCRSGELPCPDVYGSGNLITAPWSHPIGTIWGLPPDADPAEVHARGAVALAEEEPAGPLLDRKLAAGVDAIKIVIEDGIGPRTPMPRLSADKVAEIVREAHARDLRVFTHVSMRRHADDAVGAGVDGLMHATDDRLPDRLIEAMATQRTFFVATLALLDGLFSHAEGEFGYEPFALAGVSPRAIASLDDPHWRTTPYAYDTAEEARGVRAVVQENVRRLAAAGVPFALGSDANNPRVFPGYSAHQELALLVEAGLSDAQALAAATTGGAAFLKAEDRLGRIAPGYEADLLLLGSNPLDGVRATRDLRMVVSDGRPVPGSVSATPRHAPPRP